MTRTSQLQAHYAVIQLDAVESHVVMSFRRTVELLIADWRERNADDAGKRRLRELLTRYRSGVIELADTLAALRVQCGTDKADLPDGDDDVRDELARLRAVHEKADRTVCRPAWAYCFADPAIAAADDKAIIAAADGKAIDTLREGGAE